MKNLSILKKLIILVVFMAAVTGLVGWVGYTNLGLLGQAGKDIDDADSLALKAARMSQIAIVLNRGEYRAGLDPSPENIKSLREGVETRKETAAKLLADIEAAATPDEKSMLVQLRSEYQNYLVNVNATLAEADKRSSDVALDEARKIIYQSVLTGRALATRLLDTSEGLANYYDAKGTKAANRGVALAETAQIKMMSFAIGGVLLGVAVGYLIGSQNIAKPLVQAVESLKALSAGDTDKTIFGIGRRDEIGLIAGTMEVFRENIIRTRQMEADARAAEQRAAEDRKTGLNRLAEAFRSSVGGIVESVSTAAEQVKSSSQALSATAEQTSRQSTNVAAAAEQASANVQTVASATEELSASITEIAKQVAKSTEIAGRAVHQAEETHAQVQSLSQASQKIGEVINLINDIASQTNLLALNATIEAARAGEAGKGFAVVASEVKSLATQTGRATEEISQQILDIQHATAQSVEAIDAIGKVIVEMNQIATAIAGAVEEQGAAANEIARNIEQAAVGTQDVTSNISGVSHAAGETGVAAGDMLTAATQLAGSSSSLSQEVERFLKTVRQG